MSHNRNASRSAPCATPRRPLSCAMLALLPALLLASCGGVTDDSSPQAAPASENASAVQVADSAQVDPAMAEQPCVLLLPTEMVATVFDVPAAEIELSDYGFSCEYMRDSDKQRLLVHLGMVDVSEDAKQAHFHFLSSTQEVGGKKLDKLKADIKAKAAESGALDNAGKRVAADALIGSTSGSKGIHYEDVQGVGDEARFSLTSPTGDLQVRVGNLNFRVSAYSGPAMPDSSGGPSNIISNMRAWQQETMSQRKQAAIKLAKAVIASL